LEIGGTTIHLAPANFSGVVLDIPTGQKNEYVNAKDQNNKNLSDACLKCTLYNRGIEGEGKLDEFLQGKPLSSVSERDLDDANVVVEELRGLEHFLSVDLPRDHALKEGNDAFEPHRPMFFSSGSQRVGALQKLAEADLEKCTRRQLRHLRNSILLFVKSGGDREKYRHVRERVPRIAAHTHAVLSDEDAAALQSIEESEAWKEREREKAEREKARKEKERKKAEREKEREQQLAKARQERKQQLAKARQEGQQKEKEKERQERQEREQQLELAREMGLPEGWAACEYKYAARVQRRIYSPDREHAFWSKKAAFAHLQRDQQWVKERLERERELKEKINTDPALAIGGAMSLPGWRVVQRAQGGFQFTSPDQETCYDLNEAKKIHKEKFCRSSSTK